MAGLHQIKNVRRGCGNRKKTNVPNNINEITASVAQLHEKIDQLAREYDRLPPGNPRREEIANEISTLGLGLERLKKNR